MGKPVARLGDTTNHGGTIVTGSTGTIVNGKPVARMGDLHACPRKGHGLTRIVSGSTTTLIEGKPTARMGDTTGCGAVIVTASPDTTG